MSTWTLVGDIKTICIYTYSYCTYVCFIVVVCGISVIDLSHLCQKEMYMHTCTYVERHNIMIAFGCVCTGGLAYIFHLWDDWLYCNLSSGLRKAKRKE